MATSHSILFILVLAAVLAPSSATWKDYPSPSYGGGGQSTPYYGKPPKHHHHKPPRYNFPPCYPSPPSYTPPYNPSPSPPPYTPPYNPSPPYTPPYTPPYNPPSPPPSPPYYYPPAGNTCPIDAQKLNECADVLAGDDPIHLLIGKEEVKAKCCPLFSEAADTDAAACLCTAIRDRAPGKLYVLVALKLLKTCGKDLLPYGFQQCLPLHPADSATNNKVDDHPQLGA